MKTLIIIDNFVFCPLQQMPMLGTYCLECDYLDKTGQDYYCTCDFNEENNDSEEFSIKKIINLLIDLLTTGQDTINREEILILTEKCK